jgi:hypothetical protein
MKEKLVAGLFGLVLGLAPAALGQPAQIWENWGDIQIPPPTSEIDALTVINHKGATFNVTGTALFNTYDTLNFTNQGLMFGNPGFDFETVPSSTGFAHMASSFVNEASGLGPNSGVIDCNGAFSFIITPFLFFGNLTGSSKCVIGATNIVNSGSINMDASSLIKLSGNNIDLSRGALSMTTAVNGGVGNASLLDGYWGVGTADPFFALVGQATPLFPPQLLQNPLFTDSYLVSGRNNQQFVNQLVVANPTVYVNQIGTGTSNQLTQAVFLFNADPTFVNTIYLSQFEIAVQWQWPSTNFPTGVVSTNNYIYLTDDFGEVTNLSLVLDGVAGPQPTYRPITYTFVQGTPYASVNPFVPPASPIVPPANLFDFAQFTNQYAAYEALFAGGTELTSDVAGGNVTNLAGRIELAAANSLNLTQTRISALNYLLLRSTNHFIGSAGAFIASPTMDIYLGSTNGVMMVTNVVAPYLNHISGPIELWSARWTNFVNGITNSFHALVVDSRISPTTSPVIQTLDLRAPKPTNGTSSIVINDFLNVSSNLVLSAERLTIATNFNNPFTPYGHLDIVTPNILWSTATTNVQFFTNWGIIQAENAMYFGGSRTGPFSSTNLIDASYQTLINHGVISNQSSLMWVDHFENNGVIEATSGSIGLQKASFALMTNGAFLAPGGDVFIAASTLFASNHALIAGGALTLNVTGTLDDGSFETNGAFGVTNKNFWSAGNGIDLPTAPASGTLLATTITNTAPDFQLVVNTWGAPDLGPNPAAFSNNTAIGHLILDGRTNSAFQFSATGAASAMYVDLLDIRGFPAINVDQFGNFLSLICDPNMKVYFGGALANGQEVAEKLAQVNGGRFIWVSNYNTGFFSSTNMVYADGTTNRLNYALVTSCDIDSNGNGIPNCLDPSPVPIVSSAAVGLKVDYTTGPTPAALVSWMGFPSSTNSLYTAPVADSTQWELVTNFVYPGMFPGRVMVTDLIKTNGPRFYRVRVGVP